LELAADGTIGIVALGLNAGHRWRQPGEKIADDNPIIPLSNQIIASGAASLLFSAIDTKLIFEIFGSRPTQSDDNESDSDRLESSAEALVGVKHDFNHNIAGHFGVGTEAIHGLSSPDWRLYAGINYSTGPSFSKPRQPIVANPSEKPKTFSSKKVDPFSGPPKLQEKIIIHDILFEFDSDHMVLPGANQTLVKLAEYLQRKPVFKHLVIEGHTDSIGTNAYNRDLSQRRANTIKRWLETRFKLNPSQITARGKGEQFPIADNGNYQGRQLNRRVEFLIYRE